MAVVRLLLDNDVNAESRDKCGWTPLFWAVKMACEELLLVRGVSVESRDEYGRTLLSWAAGYGNEAVVRLLLAEGADANSKHRYGRTHLSLMLKLLRVLVPRRAISPLTDKRLMSQAYVRIHLFSRAASVVTLGASNVWRECPKKMLDVVRPV
jgi:ankyrin repeat protein